MADETTARDTEPSTEDLGAERQEPPGDTADNANRAEPANDAVTGDGPLLSVAGDFRARWDQVQRSFVDEPQRSVEQADALVSEVIDQLTAMFAAARQRLETEWSQGKDASTEDLRQALRQYRSFFNLLLEHDVGLRPK